MISTNPNISVSHDSSVHRNHWKHPVMCLKKNRAKTVFFLFSAAAGMFACLLTVVHLLAVSVGASLQPHLSDSLTTARRYGIWVTSSAEGDRSAGTDMDTSLKSSSWHCGYLDSKCRVHVRQLEVLWGKNTSLQ